MRLFLCLLVATAVSGCACGGQPCETPADCEPGYVCAQGACQYAGAQRDGGERTDGGGADAGHADAGAPVVVALSLTPSQATLNSRNGSQPTQDFQVTALYSDGRTVALTTADLSVDRLNIGAVTPGTARFTASGLVAWPPSPPSTSPGAPP